MTAPRQDLIAVCPRTRANELIAAECERLTGGRPDGDGVADVDHVGRIAQAAFVRCGLRVVARAPSFEALVDRVTRTGYEADRFRIDVHDPSARLGMASRDAVIAIADLTDSHPDLSDPAHRFLIVARPGEVVFGEVVVRADRSFKAHAAKPWTTSASLDGRFSRALVNLVPDAGSILDPCCGAGSILIEAAALGVTAHGVDWKPALAGMTRQNLAALGYRGTVVQADAREHVQTADAIVTDLPYGHSLSTDEATIRGILDHCATLAPVAVYVAPRAITPWLTDAGYVDVEVHSVNKRVGSSRFVHVARSSRGGR